MQCSPAGGVIVCTLPLAYYNGACAIEGAELLKSNTELRQGEHYESTHQ